MIVKKLKRSVINKPKATIISGMVDYILAPTDEFGREKCVYANTKNFISMSTAAQKMEMISLAEESVHSKMPVTHWILSWSDNETPTTAQVDEAVAMFLKGMELEEYQAIYAVHGNTDNYHVHILVNRVHPYTEKVVQPHHGFDIRAAHRILAEIEYKQGWRSEKRALFAVDDNGNVVRNTHVPKVQPPPKAADKERITGEKSAIRIAQEKTRDLLKNIHSWEDLHIAFNETGLQYQRKGSGAIILVGTTPVKASSVGREFSLPNLEKRFKKFWHSVFEEPDPYTPEPLSDHICHEQWREFRAQKHEAQQLNACIRRGNKNRKETLKESQQAERQRVAAQLVGYERPIQKIARYFLRQKQEKEHEDVQKTMIAPLRIPPISFKEWLRHKYGQQISDLWRFHENIPTDATLVDHRFLPMDLDTTYDTFIEIACRSHTDTPMEASRLAGMAAFYMFCGGYTKEETAKALSEYFLQHGGSSQRLPLSIERHINAAYGTRGCITLGRLDDHKSFVRRLRRLAMQIDTRKRAEVQREAEDEQAAITEESSPIPQISTAPTEAEEPRLFDRVGQALFGWLGKGKEDKNKKEEEQERQRQEAILPQPPQHKPPLPDVDWSLLDGEWDDFEWRKPTPQLKPRQNSMRELEATQAQSVLPISSHRGTQETQTETKVQSSAPTSDSPKEEKSQPSVRFRM